MGRCGVMCLDAADLHSDIGAETHSCAKWWHTASAANTNPETEVEYIFFEVLQGHREGVVLLEV